MPPCGVTGDVSFPSPKEDTDIHSPCLQLLSLQGGDKAQPKESQPGENDKPDDATCGHCGGGGREEGENEVWFLGPEGETGAPRFRIAPSELHMEEEGRVSLGVALGL